MSGLGEILVVEDTPASLKLLSDLLGNAGYLVRQAPDGELALWSASARPPELVLLDVNMPGIDGFEVCRRLKADPALCDIPVIFLSAQYEMDDKVRGFQSGAVDFIAKPYQAEEVLARAQAHIRLARTQKALKEALEQLRSARAEVARNERMAALGALVAGVAHELNTPIGNSVLIASTLEDRARAFGAQIGAGVRRSDLEHFAADTAKAAGLLLRSLHKSSSLVESFKQVAVDQSSEQRTRFQLADLVAQALQPLKAGLAADGIALETGVPPGLEMDSYPRPVAHILQQLVRNAQLHAFGAMGSAGGTIRVQASAIDGGQLLLAVQDNGCGIAPGTLERIFDPFFTTRMGTGTGGLGLHVVHNLLCHVLGGQVSVDSTPGATSFRITLPLTAPALCP
ncbi:sensor histidine kinase [Pseudoduganella sp.]|uniref:sensor histidine kinase n=1 Tax=Pseudoduganella sp. TaxID=1880898 RepID=UPI0035B21E07